MVRVSNNKTGDASGGRSVGCLSLSGALPKQLLVGVPSAPLSFLLDAGGSSSAVNVTFRSEPAGELLVRPPWVVVEAGGVRSAPFTITALQGATPAAAGHSAALRLAVA